MYNLSVFYLVLSIILFIGSLILLPTLIDRERKDIDRKNKK